MKKNLFGKILALLCTAGMLFAAAGCADNSDGNESMTYTVTFDSNGGSTVAPQTVKSGEKAVEPKDPERTGYSFNEWQLSGKKFDFNQTITADITLTAAWTKNNGNDPNGNEKDALTIVNGVVTKCDTTASGEIYIPTGVTAIGERAFNNCTKITSVIVPYGVTSIEKEAFYNCTAMESIRIPATVITIGKYAFQHCKNLTVYYEGTEAQWQARKFDTTGMKTIIYLGDSGDDNPDDKGGDGSGNATGSDNNGENSNGSNSDDNTDNDNKDDNKEETPGGSTSGENQGSGEEKQDGYLTIKGGVVIKCDPAAEGYLMIPSYVTAIGDSAFIGCSKIEVIKMQDGIKAIGAHAFEGCTNLTSIEIPASVTSIGSGALEYCGKLTTVNFTGTPSQLSKLSIDAKGIDTKTATITCNYGKTNAVICHFGECLTITNEESYDLVTKCDATVKGYVIIPSNVVGIDIEAFKDCTGITGVIIPDGVMLIDEEAFSGCTNLAYIEIPGSVVSVGRNVFDDCDNLNEINYTGTIANYAETDFNVGSIFPNIANVTISGKSVKQITEITATDLSGVTIIGSQAFRGWSGLRSVTIPNSVETLDYGAFADCTGLVSVTLPGSLASIGTYAFENCTSLNSVEIPNGIKTIEYGAFKGCTNLSSVTIASSVTTIEQYAFHSCTRLKTLNLPSSVTSIGRYAFTTSTGMTVNYAGTIGTWAGVTINTSHGGSPSGGTHSSDNGRGESSNDRYEPNPMFRDNDNVTFVVNGKKASEITEITEADLAGATAIRDYAFFAWKGLQTVTIPSGISTVYGYAFAECTNLKEITMQGSNTTLREWCFCKVTANMYVPSGYKTTYENMLENSQHSWSYDVNNEVTVTVVEQ